MMDAFATALLIFVLRAGDVTVGTLRVLNMVRGKRLTASVLGFFEASLFLFALTRVFQALHNPWNMVGYAAGFACGTALGVTVERWMASGYLLVRMISRRKTTELLATLRRHRFGVTALAGEGRSGGVVMLFVATSRRRGRQLLELARGVDRQMFITVEPLYQAYGGYIPNVAAPAGVRK